MGGRQPPPAETGANLNRIRLNRIEIQLNPIELNRIEPDWVESDWTGLDMDLSRIDMNRIEPDWVGIGTGSNRTGFLRPTNQIEPVFDPKEPDWAETGSNRTGTSLFNLPASALEPNPLMVFERPPNNSAA